MHFLITRPEHETTVRYLSKWAKEHIELAEAKAIKVLDCLGEKAKRKIVEEMILKHNPEIIMLNGHGAPDKVYGHKDEILIEKDKNDSLLKGAIVYAFSCNSAAQLGESCIEKGTRAYIGYKDEFCFWTDNISWSNPLNDRLAAPCLLPSNQIMHSLLKGKLAKEAYDNSQRVFDEQIEELQKSDAPPEAEYILPLLVWDKANQVLLGNKNAQI